MFCGRPGKGTVNNKDIAGGWAAAGEGAVVVGTAWAGEETRQDRQDVGSDVVCLAAQR